MPQLQFSVMNNKLLYSIIMKCIFTEAYISNHIVLRGMTFLKAVTLHTN